MKHRLPIVFVTVLLAALRAEGEPATPAATPNQTPPNGVSLIRQAAQQMNRQASFRANLRQRVDLLDQNVVGSGTYLQKQSSRGLLVRLDWKIPLADRVASVQYIGDGRFLWIRRDLFDSPTLQRVDLDRVHAAFDPGATAGQSEWGWNELTAVGLPRLLLSLSDNFEFQPPRAARLGDLPVWVAEGTRSPGRNSRPPARDDPAPDRTARLPHVPTHVRVVVRQQDSQLQRVEYLRAREEDPSGNQAIAAQKWQTLAVLDILDAAGGVPLDDGLFVCDPGQQEVADHTDRYLYGLRGLRTQ